MIEKTFSTVVVLHIICEYSCNIQFLVAPSFDIRLTVLFYIQIVQFATIIYPCLPNKKVQILSPFNNSDISHFIHSVIMNIYVCFDQYNILYHYPNGILLKLIETISWCNRLLMQVIILHTSLFAGEFKPISCCITCFTFVCTTAHIICVNTCVRIYRMHAKTLTNDFLAPSLSASLYGRPRIITINHLKSWLTNLFQNQLFDSC